MKNIIKLNLWGALIVLASQVSAADANSNLNVSVTGQKTFELTMTNVKGAVDLYLRGERNELIYQNTIATSGSLSKSFDMSLFSDGRYVIELVDSEKNQSLPVIIKDNVLSIEVSDAKTHFLPVLYQKDQIVSVNMLAVNGEDLSVIILNPADQVIYKETLTGDGNIGKIFDFSSTLNGDYEFQLISNGTVLTKEVTIE